MFVTKGKCSSALASAYSIGSLASNLISVNANKDIRNTTITGWGYSMKLVPNSNKNSATVYLLTYNAKGKLVETKKCGSVTINPYCKVIK